MNTNTLLADAARRACAYLESLPQRPVAPDPRGVERLKRLDESLPSGPSDPTETLALLDEVVTPATMAMAGPRFFGFVIGGALPGTLAVNWLASAWDQNTGLFNSTPGTAYLEQVALGWLVDLFELPQGTAGAFVTGATVANFTALAAARNAVLARTGWNVEADGLFGAPLVARAHAAGAWVHVDGAFGLWTKAAPQLRALARGLEKADSWATDAHKWLNVPYDSGLAFVRDAHALKAAMSITAEYPPTEAPVRNPSDYTPELSRRARGVEVWAALRMLGRAGLAELFERSCRQARRFAEGLRKAGYRVLNDVVLNQVLVDFGGPQRTLQTIEAIQKDGTCRCGNTVWQGRTAMRISVCCWATRDEDVERSLDAMLQAARSAG